MITITLEGWEAGQLVSLLENAAEDAREREAAATNDNEPGIASNYNTLAWVADELIDKVIEATKEAKS